MRKNIVKMSAILTALVALSACSNTNNSAEDLGLNETQVSFHEHDTDDGVWVTRDLQTFEWSLSRQVSIFDNRWDSTGKSIEASHVPQNEMFRVFMPVRSTNSFSRITPVPNINDNVLGCRVQGNFFFGFGSTAEEAEAFGLMSSQVDMFAGVEHVWLIADLLATEDNLCNIEEIMDTLKLSVAPLEIPMTFNFDAEEVEADVVD